ncbi:hypothetical protein WOLCODRAFT_42773, partial [Wolfiporia cocos MD-104 SS10]
MGKLNIAHHKSYHPYRRDNIERVRRDEEEARLQEAVSEGRMMLADSEARMDLLRQRAGVSRSNDDGTDPDAPVAGPSSLTSTSGGHINLFEDLEQQAVLAQARSTKKPAPETEKGIPLAPTEKDLTPWYSGRRAEKAHDADDGHRTRDLARKSVHDPLTSINHQLAAKAPNSPAPARARPSTDGAQQQRPPEAARAVRESAERQRALELIRRRRREAAGGETPSTVRGDPHEGYRDVFNRREVDEARRGRERR